MLLKDELPKEKQIKIFFAPWNREGVYIKLACDDTKLEFCNVKKGEWNGYYIRSFHWWNLIIGNWKLNL